MDSDILSLDSSENLKCAVCKNYLSYFPILLTNDGENICGRCPVNVISYQNLAFEAVAKFISFSCRYKKEGCNEKMVQEDVSNHEAICPYKILRCPSANFTTCNWKGTRPTIMEHCLDKHFELFLQEKEFLLDFSQSSHSDNFLNHDNVLYIFSRTFDATCNVFRCSIHHIEGEIDVKNYSCQVSLRNGKRVVLDECSATAYEDINYISIGLDSLKVKNGNSTISGRITFGKYIENSVSLHEDLLSQLKCSICSTYVLPPIYHHNDNKIYCSKCKSGYKFKNYSLDNIAKMLNYPCVNKHGGCSVILKPEKMEKHHKLCRYRLHNCPLSIKPSCSWEGIGQELLNHFNKNHKEVLTENRLQITVTNCDKDGSSFLFMKHLNHLFKIMFYQKICSKYRCFYWRVEQVDYFENTNFQFEIEVIDTTNNYRRFLGRQRSVRFSNTDAFSFNEEECCVLTFTSQQLNNLLKNNELNFKVTIFQ